MKPLWKEPFFIGLTILIVGLIAAGIFGAYQHEQEIDHTCPDAWHYEYGPPIYVKSGSVMMPIEQKWKVCD